MTDLAQGPGWWQASDGKWYPPEQHPSHAVQTLTLPPTQSYSDFSQPSTTPGKPKKPFWRRWWAIAIGAFILLMVAVSLAGSPEETTTETATETPAEPATDDDAEPSDDAAGEVSDEPVVEAPAPEEAAPESNLTPSQQNAVRAAESYLDFSGFSRQGLIDQLSSEFGDQFPVEDATVAVDSLQVDWLAEALESAESYLDFSGFSRQGLIDQLSSEFGDQFTIEQAVFAADNVGADWNAEAVESAQSYLDFSGFSCQGLIDQLSSEYGSQFTIEQATYGAAQTGSC
jgi:hypothetical protein